MEEVINKPDNQFKDILNDLIDYSKSSEEKSALIEEVCPSKHPSKPTASLNPSTYSSAASSSSSTSSASDSSTNSASSSSTSSTLSSPSQSSQANDEINPKRSNILNDEFDKIEVAKMEDLGKTARILEQRIALSSEHRRAADREGPIAILSQSHIRSINSNIITPRPSIISQASSPKPHQLEADSFRHSIQIGNNHVNDKLVTDNCVPTNSWTTIRRDKRRKKPTEQPVLSQHIPGHRGTEHDVDSLVNFINKSGGGTTGNASGNNASKKNNKNTKAQSKRPPNQNIELKSENQQRKSNANTTSTNTNKTPPQPRTPSFNQNLSSTESSDDTMKEAHSINDKKKLHVRATNQSQPTKQSPSQDSANTRSEERTDIIQRPAATNHKRKQEQKRDKSELDEAVVTFADHIRVNNDDESERYTFGFFEEKQTTDQAKSKKVTAKQTVNNKSSQNGHKHRIKYPKTSLNSEQKRYKYNDNINANSFNYHQIIEFISNSWANTAINF